MLTTATSLAALLYLCSHTITTDDVLAPLYAPQNLAPKSDAQGCKRTPPAYIFGKTAAQSLDEAIDKGFVKNENPLKPTRPLLTSLEVGNCVIVPRSDKTFSFGVITEVMSPSLVCVACGSSASSEDDIAIKIIPSLQLFLNPYWLNHTFKDSYTLAHFNQAVRPSAPPPL